MSMFKCHCCHRRIQLQAPTPVGGVVVTLSSIDTAAASVQASIKIPAGQSSGTFTVKSHVVAATTTATITASSGGTGEVAVLTVNPGG